MVEETFAAAEEDGHDRQVQIVDEAGPQVLLDRGHAAAEPDVGLAGGIGRPLQGRLDAVLDEVEGGPALHLDGCMRPFMEPRAAHTQRVVDALVGSCREAVERDGEVVDAELRHVRECEPAWPRSERPA